jgi:hypothetical protein
MSKKSIIISSQTFRSFIRNYLKITILTDRTSFCHLPTLIEPDFLPSFYWNLQNIKIQTCPIWDSQGSDYEEYHLLEVLMCSIVEV